MASSRFLAFVFLVFTFAAATTPVRLGPAPVSPGVRGDLTNEAGWLAEYEAAYPDCWPYRTLDTQGRTPASILAVKRDGKTLRITQDRLSRIRVDNNSRNDVDVVGFCAEPARTTSPSG